MLGLSREIAVRWWLVARWLTVATFCLAAAGSGAGCATSGPASTFRTIQFEGTGWIATVDGPVGHTESRHDSRHRLAEFLYGPESDDTSSLRNPQALRSRGGRVFACDQGLPGIVELDSADGSSRLWTRSGALPACPVDITFDDQGGAYVADAALRAVLVYDPTGRRTHQLQPPDPNLFRPSAVLMHENVLYVSNSAGRKVERFDLSTQTWVEALSVDGLGVPTGLAAAGDGRLLVCDALLGVVHRVTKDGRRLGVLGRRGRGPGELVRPSHIATTAEGLILVVDAARQSLVVFSETGTFVLEIGATDQWPGFTLPAGVTAVEMMSANDEVSMRNDVSNVRILVSDTLGEVPLTQITIRPKHRDAAAQ